MGKKENKCDCHNHKNQVCDVCQCVTGDEIDMIDVNDNFTEEINQGQYLEVMDRVHIIQCTLDDFIYNHPVMTKKQKRRIEKTQEILTKVYQWSSSKFDEFNECEE